MDIFNVLTMIGGLTLFLYGMETMGNGLVKLSGGKMEKILEKLTGTRIMALLLGAFVTAVIQSSSATTVMVVGFVNSGIMKLTQAVGVIMGANIGTTMTSWILSLTGISSGNLLLKMLKPSSFSPILAVIGIVCMMAGKEGSKRKNVGNILLGFAVLMFGMETMSGAVAPLKDSPAFTGLFTAFSNPVIGMLAGAVLTAIIQSSSASVGILQALCISGAVSFGSAIPIIMGQNIGTCVTALISSIGASKNAKRAAFVHLYFNLIGTVLFMVFFYGINSFVHFSFLSSSASAADIALVHSIFNIGCAIVLFPFGKYLEKLASLTVRKQKSKEKEYLPAVLIALDERFLDSPSFAIEMCKNAVQEMADISRNAIEKAIILQNDYSDALAGEVETLERTADTFEDRLGSYLVKLAGRDLNNEDSHMLSLMFHAISNIERISDHAINLTEAARKMKAQGLKLSEQGSRELESLGHVIKDIVDLTTEAFTANEIDMAVKVEPLEEVIDDLVMEMKQRHIVRLRKGECSMETGILLEDILTYYERVSDHCSNIAAAMIEIPSDVFDMHEYLDVKIKGNDPHFREEYVRLKKIYALP